MEEVVLGVNGYKGFCFTYKTKVVITQVMQLMSQLTSSK